MTYLIGIDGGKPLRPAMIRMDVRSNAEADMVADSGEQVMEEGLPFLRNKAR